MQQLRTRSRQNEIVDRFGGKQRSFVGGDKSGIGFARQKGRVLHQRLQERQIGFHANHFGFGQCTAHAADRFGPIAAPGNQFGDHRIVEHADLITTHHTGIETNIFAIDYRRRGEHSQIADFRQEIIGRALGADTHFNGVSAANNFVLIQRQRLTGRHQ